MYSKFNNKDPIEFAVSSWLGNETSVSENYGDINSWDVGNETYLRYAFYRAELFDQNLALWNLILNFVKIMKMTF